MKLMINPHDIDSLEEAKAFINKTNFDISQGEMTDDILEQIIINNLTISEIDYFISLIKK